MKKKKRAIRAYRPMPLIERYGRAVLRMENREWDELIAPKPKGFDDLPIEEKARIIDPYLKEAHFIVGQEYITYLRRIVDFKESEEEWLEGRKLAYAQNRQRLYAEYVKEMAMYSRPSTYQSGNAVDYSGKSKKRKQRRNQKLNLVPAFIRELFFK